MNGQQHCEYSAADFEATVIETTDTRLIHVTGHGLCSAGSLPTRSSRQPWGTNIPKRIRPA